MKPHANIAWLALTGPPAVPLGPEDAEPMLDLADLTRPGPFGPRTVELGEYFGVLDGRRLVAMAGERMGFRDHREIAVRVVCRCSHRSDRVSPQMSGN